MQGSANGKERSTGVYQRLIPISLVAFCGTLGKNGAGRRRIFCKPVEISNFHPSWEEFSNSQGAEEISV